MRATARAMLCALALAASPSAVAQTAPASEQPSPVNLAPTADLDPGPETLTISSAPAAAPDPITASPPDPGSGSEGRPGAAGRIVRLFDFEERWTNSTDIPAFWVRAQHDPAVPRIRPGFPSWNHAALDYRSPAARGEGSARLPTQGGSVSLRLDPGVLPIFAGADYTIRALVRTEGLEHARARLTARQLTANGSPIPGTDQHSEPLLSPNAWASFELLIAGTAPDAAFLQLDLELLQPDQLHPAAGRIHTQDLSGTAWFDDVAVLQSPRVRFSVSGRGGVVLAPETPEFELNVRDLTGEALTVHLTLFDARGEIVRREIAELGVGRAAHTWSPAVDRFGWYRCTAEVLGPDGLVAAGVADTLVLPPVGAPGLREARERARFTVWLSTLAPDQHEHLPLALRHSGIGSVVLPFWTPDLTAEAVSDRVSALLALRADLHRASIDTGIGLIETPPALALTTGVDRDDPLGALATDAILWKPWAAELFERLGEGTQRWALGLPGSSAAWRDPRLEATLARAHASASPFAPAPRFLLGWRATEAPRPTLLTSPAFSAAGLEVLVPHELPPASIAHLADGPLAPLAAPSGSSGEPNTVSDGPSLTLVIEPQPWQRIGAHEAASDAARRALEALAAFAMRHDGDGYPLTRLALLDPWRRTLAATTPGPEPALAAWRTLSDALTERVPAEQWQPAPGVRVLMLEPRADADSATGAIALWADRAEGEQRDLNLPLALGTVTVIDVFGNRRTLDPAPSEDGRLGIHPVRPGSSPVIIEGVDLRLLRFLASVRLDPPMVEAASVERTHRVLFHNPWPTDLTGRLVVVQPGGRPDAGQPRDRSWDIVPRSLPFAVGAGAAGDLPLIITLSPGVEAGEHEAIIDFELGTDTRYGWVRIHQPIRVGLRWLRVELSARRARAGADTIIEARITNTGAETLDIEASAFVPSAGRTRAAGLRLGPGQSAVRLFPFADAPAIAGQRAIVGVADRTNQARLNTSIVLP